MRIDVNTSLGCWPFQRFAQTSGTELVRHLRAEGIDRALVSSIDATFDPDLHACDADLRTQTDPHPELVPLSTVNPTLPGWERNLEGGGVPAVRLLPGYHQYGLDAVGVRKLAGALAERKGVLVIQVRLEDERSHYPLCRIPPVEMQAIRLLARALPELRILCLCCYGETAKELAGTCRNVHVDLSMIEELDTVNRLLDEVAPEQVLFGSHTPFLTTRAAVMKLQACSDPDAAAAIAAANARRLFGL